MDRLIFPRENLLNRVRPRFFDQVGHESMYASSGNKHFSLNLQTYQNYEQSQDKLGTSQIFFIDFFFGRIRPIFNTKNDFECTNFEMFKEVVHNFGKSDDDII